MHIGDMILISSFLLGILWTFSGFGCPRDENWIISFYIMKENVDFCQTLFIIPKCIPLTVFKLPVVLIKVSRIKYIKNSTGKCEIRWFFDLDRNTTTSFVLDHYHK